MPVYAVLAKKKKKEKKTLPQGLCKGKNKNTADLAGWMDGWNRKNSAVNSGQKWWVRGAKQQITKSTRQNTRAAEGAQESQGAGSIGSFW